MTRQLGLLLGLSALALAAFPTGAVAEPLSATLGIEVNIKGTISATPLNNMDFGDVYWGSSAKTINPDTDAPKAATFDLVGPSNRNVTFTAPATATLTAVGGQTLTVSNLTILSMWWDAANDCFGNSTVRNFPANGTTPPSGTCKLYVGGTLQAVPMNQTEGTYYGQVAVTVATP